MTLEEFFQKIADNPAYVIFYFTIIPLTAVLAGWMGKGEGHISPWKYLYSTLIYMVSVPGIFAVTLSIYFFLFERRSIMDTDVFIQILPVISMVVTLLIIRRNVRLEHIPGFDKLSGLIMMISATLAIMWFIDRTHIIVFTHIPFMYVILIFAALLVAIRIGWKRLFAGNA
ncbi:MAG: hypothetical protein R2824_16310 [Saprospiraceae bacterium]